jgi:two-component system, cell cycle response regulator
MVYLLSAFGHETLQALDGEKGLELAGRERLDLILLDIHMPRMDGYEVVRHLKETPECRAIPVVAVTALAMVGDCEKILASGFSGYIAKPVDPQAFPTQIEGFLGAARSAVPCPTPRWQLQDVPARTAPREKWAIVLVVDNLQTNIDLVRSVLEPSGCEVVGALSAKEGFDLARRTKPDLILSDIHMLHKNGYEFRGMVQADPELSTTPFVFLSSSALTTQERRRAMELGATKFIARPVEPQTLLDQLKDCLPKQVAEQWRKF